MTARAVGNSGPLAGIVVGDFSRVLAGPYCTMLLADMGADVIKVESPSGDDTRSWMPPVHDGVSTYYLGINRNKRSVVLDFRDHEDLADARALAGRADVIVENFKPGGMKRFGLDYDSVRDTNPSVVYASINGFGSDAGAGIPGYDLMIQALSGLMSLTGDADGPAYRAGISVFDVMAGLHATIGILAALNQRRDAGVGQHIEVSLMTSALSGLVNHTSAVLAGNAVPYRMGNAHPSLFPYEPMPTRDGELIIIAGNDQQFRALCTVLDSPELIDDARFARNQDRTRNRDVLRPLLEARLRTRTSDELFTALIAAGVPSAPIQTIDKGIEFASKIGLNPVIEVGEGDRSLAMARNPISFSDARLRYDLPPPTLGEHSDEIRRWLREGRREQG